jgi:hypothetical protein
LECSNFFYPCLVIFLKIRLSFHVFRQERVRIFLIRLELFGHSFQLALLLNLNELGMLHVLLKSQLLKRLCFEVLAQLVKLGIQQVSQMTLKRKCKLYLVFINCRLKLLNGLLFRLQ